jgi:hypothetical protein
MKKWVAKYYILDHILKPVTRIRILSSTCKKNKKNWIPAILWLLNNKQKKTWEEELIFCWHHESHRSKEQDPDP